MVFNTKSKRIKFAAVFLSFNLLLEICFPVLAYGLTGGPSQPEVDSFEPVGTTQMVDLFSGDFNYNIPLFDVGGYPVNLAYHGGVGMEQEASWVGLGWNINPGAINRTMRGIPDDFNGDEIKKEYNIKDNVTYGTNVGISFELFGIKAFSGGNDGSDSKENDVSFSLGLNFGIYRNSYKGLGTSIDINSSMKITSSSEKENNYQARYNDKENKVGRYLDNKTSSQAKEFNANLGLGLNSQSGADWQGSISFSNKIRDNETGNNSNWGAQIGLGHNSLDGLKTLSYKILASRSKLNNKGNRRNRGLQESSSIPIGLNTYFPNINMETRSSSISLNVNLGPDAMGAHPSMRFNGFYNIEKLYKNKKSAKSYGFLYQHNSYKDGSYDRHAILDFNREKESAYTKNLSNLPLTNPTYDLFSISGQGTGGMYRAHRNNIGVYYDSEAKNKHGKAGQHELGLETGIGQAIHIGVNYVNKRQETITGLWEKDNELLETANYKDPSKNEDYNFEQTHFKMGGEKTKVDNNLLNRYGGNLSTQFKVSKTTELDKRNGRFIVLPKTYNDTSGIVDWNPWRFKSVNREIRTNSISYLTAKEASIAGIALDRTIKSYENNNNGMQNSLGFYVDNLNVTSFERLDENGLAKPDHISEITNYNSSGVRYVYGIPAYNTYQKECVFNTSNIHSSNNRSSEDIEHGLIGYNPGEDDTKDNERGVDHYFTSTELPPFAHSYLLTGVLSPDYVDVYGDGITDDDLGTAVKFNYTLNNENYQWRTPYEKNKARLNEGFVSDVGDNKGSYVYGQKQIWYTHSIVSKTHIAEFKLSPRNDGYGVMGLQGGIDSSAANQLMKLDSIVVYSKLDRLNNGPNATPVKTIVFKYDYSLCQGVPNNKRGEGKLTLKEIYFTYGKSNKGSLSPYKFTYSDKNPEYNSSKMDRWGNYQEPDDKTFNHEFPYVKQGNSIDEINENASAWCLEEIQLPSGGRIKVEYEADDYAFVQDRKAMQMIKVVGTSDVGNANPQTLNHYLYKASKGGSQDYLYFKLPNPVSTKEELINKYFKDEKGEDINHMYYNFFVNMKRNAGNMDETPYEYIKGYAQLDYHTHDLENNLLKYYNIGLCSSDNSYAYVKLKKHQHSTYRNNPISVAAWQTGLLNLRHIMIAGSNSQYEDNEVKGAMLGLLNSIPQALNLFTGPYQYLRTKRIANKFNPEKSWIRLYNPNGSKKGGGSRVKSITINDNWSEMDSEQTSTEYGQEFDYTNDDGTSSGVASYEPAIGGDENPFRRPVYYSEDVILGPTKTKFQEEPFGESFFPGASVGYSKVTVRNIAKANVKSTATGRTVNEFYTAKDFPVHMDKTGVDRNDNQSKVGTFLKQLFSPIIRNYEAASQGFVIELNDMHGKPKAVKVYGERGNGIDLISGTEYRYKRNGKRLVNNVDLLLENGDIENHEIGKEYDIALDTRKSRSVFINGGLDWNMETLFLGVIPLPAMIPVPRFKQNESMYQSAVMTKVIQKYGILEETIAYDYGSQVSTKNLLWDEQTGQVLLTSTKNEYEDDIYNFNYPAHLAYEGMGPAYKNIGYKKQLTLNSSGKHTFTGSGNQVNHFFEGDELLLLDGEEGSKGWVLKSTDTEILVIDALGNPIEGNYSAKVIRSGRRNLSSVSVGSLVSMHNPLSNPETGLELEEKIIQTAALNYSQEWPGYCGEAHIGEHLVCDTHDMVFEMINLIKMSIDNGIGEHSYALGDIDHNPISLDELEWFNNSAIENYLEYLAEQNLITENPKYYFADSDTSEGFTNFYFVIEYGTFENRISFKSCNFFLDWTLGNFHCGKFAPYVNKITEVMDSFNLHQHDPSIRIFYARLVGTDTCQNIVDTCPGLSICPDTLEPIINSYDTVLSFYITGCNERFINCYISENCYYTLGQTLNPYVNGMRGIWRPKRTYAFVSERIYKHKNDTTDIRYDGIIKEYKPYWTFKSGSNKGIEAKSINHDKWVASTEATIYTPEGNGVEEKNALGIYSSQLFGYGNNLVTAVAANSKNKQIAFDNFEDYSFPYRGCRDDDHWDFRENLAEDGVLLYSPAMGSNISIDHFETNTQTTHAYIIKDTAHSGLYSMAINPGKEHSVTRKIDFSDVTVVGESTELFRVDSYSKCISLFAPDTAKEYVISAWMKENIQDLNSVNSFDSGKIKVTFIQDDAAFDSVIVNSSGLIIEGWQRMEGKFKIPYGTDDIKITLMNPSQHKIFYDDIRIHPYHANMKSYVYHPIHLKIMAELDENNYASFYEYDEEGSLIRMKKETEKGIVTLQETRKSIRKE